jgi:hypothetical protein
MKNKENSLEENDGVQWASATIEANLRNKLALGNKPIYLIQIKSDQTDSQSLTTKYYLSSKYEENLNYVAIYGYKFANRDMKLAFIKSSDDAKKTKNKKSNKIDINKSNWYIDLAWEDITKIATENGIKEQNLKIPWSEIKEVEILKAKIKNKE